jgi:hypothetical protein
MTMPALKLWEAGDAMEIVREWILEHDEELRANEGVFPPALAELLEKVESDFDKKAERVALFIRELLATAKAIKEEETRLAARRKSIDNAAERLKSYLELQMIANTRPHIVGQLVTLRIQKNAPSVKIERLFSQDELESLNVKFPLLVRYVEPTVGSYELVPSAIAAAARQLDGKGNLLGFKSPIGGVIVAQGESLRIR